MFHQILYAMGVHTYTYGWPEDSHSGCLEEPRIAHPLYGTCQRYADIMIDSAFKMVFGSAANMDIMIALLECLIPDKKIARLEFHDKEIPGFFVIEKKTIFDLYCKTPEGETFVVEMQLSGETYFTERALFYATYPLREQLITPLEERKSLRRGRKKQIRNYHLNPVYMVSILNFTLPHEDVSCLREGLVSSYSLRSDEGNEQMTDALHFIYLELGRLPYGVTEMGKCRTLLEKLAFALKYISFLEDRPLEFSEEFFRRLFHAAELANMTKDERENYDHDMTTYIDEVARIDYAMERGERIGLEKGERLGLEKGEQIGLEKGILLGREKMKEEWVRRMVEAGISPEVIARVMEEG